MNTGSVEGGGLRQTAALGDGKRDAVPTAHAHSAKAPKATATQRILLKDEEGAALLGVGLRSFLAMQKEPWFPKPLQLSARLKRHSYAELLAAVERMPRHDQRAEPAQLRRARIEALKGNTGGAPKQAA